MWLHQEMNPFHARIARVTLHVCTVLCFLTYHTHLPPKIQLLEIRVHIVIKETGSQGSLLLPGRSRWLLAVDTLSLRSLQKLLLLIAGFQVFSMEDYSLFIQPFTSKMLILFRGRLYARTSITLCGNRASWSSFYRENERSTRRLSDLPKMTQPASGRGWE